MIYLRQATLTVSPGTLTSKSESSVLTHQHPPASESHHAQPALEHEAFEVGGGHLPPLDGLGAVVPVGFLSLSVGVVHALHVLPQLIFPLQTQREKQIDP